MPAFRRISCLLTIALSLTACAPLLTVLGTSNTVVAVATQIERVKMVGDGISYAKSKKTLTDHALSKVLDADCKLVNILSGEKVCVPVENASPDQVAQRDAVGSPPKAEAQGAPETGTAKFETTSERTAGD